MPHARQQLGTRGELAAERFLRGRRHTIVARNYRCPLGEVDLVALDGRTLVFIEVKTRQREGEITAADAVDARKQRRLVRVARYFITQHRLEGRPVRFDVVSVRGGDGEMVCDVMTDAFGIVPGR